MNGTENPELHEELRNRIRRGDSVTDTLRFLIDTLELSPNSQLPVIAVFYRAFSIPLGEAKTLGAWEYFDGSAWSDEAINSAMWPILARSLDRGQDDSPS